ncbi:MAG: hypothetical protein QGG64_27390 [Candidatus Latescibacteria bacterium]|nr:hypothetical protein [Candidatus Latescibacterota bacterium]
MKQVMFFWFLLTCVLGTSSTMFAQGLVSGNLADDRIRALLVVPDSTQIQVITTTDGSTNMGRIIRVGDQKIDFKTDLGMVSIPISKIKHIEMMPATSIHKGEIWFTNPNATRLFFAPTGRMIKQGKGYFSDYYLFFPGFSYGLTDRFTLGGGVSIFPGVDMNDQLFFITPKLGLVQNESVQFALGALIVRVPGDDGWDDDPEGAGILYGVTTFGNPDASLTLGLGYGFVGGNLAERPMVVVGGEKRLTRRMSFVSENWIYPGIDEPLISYGLRFFGKRLSVDLAFLNIVGEEAIFPGVPYIDFVFQF